MDALRSQHAPPRFVRLPPGHRVELPDARRADAARLRREIRAISESPVVSAVLEVADAVLIVLNRERQIVGFNSRVDAVRSAVDVLGLRPGEALGCANAAGPGGCGTEPGCATCGALGAVLGCQAQERPVEAECLIRSHGAVRALEFNVRATPVRVADEGFTVVSLRDISGEKRRDALEQVFFHDVLNTVAGLRGWAQRMQRAGAELPRATERIDFLAGQIEREIKDHRAIVLAERGALVPERLPFRAGEVLRGVAAVFAGHPVARDRHLEVQAPGDDPELRSDRALLLRVMVNMVRNALEATEPGGVVRLWSDVEGAAVTLHVHNAQAMTPEVQARVFQRSFSTKGERGRGLGTYSMKLFGEQYLGGRVSFVSDPAGGTVFTIRLPRPAAPPDVPRSPGDGTCRVAPSLGSGSSPRPAPRVTCVGMRTGEDAEDALSAALAALAVERASACLLDASGRFVAVNHAWDRFAADNGGGSTCRGEHLLGSEYPRHVEGEAPRAKIERELARTLSGESFSVDAECSSPQVLRLLRTQHVPVRQSEREIVGVLLVHTVVHQCPMAAARPLAPPDEALYRRLDGLVLMCCNCRRVHRVGSVGRWDFVPAYLERPPVPVTHGFCEPCFLQFGAGARRGA